MHILTPKKKKPSELFARAAVFAIFFLIALIFFIISSKKEKSDSPKTALLNDYDILVKYKSFEEKQKDELKARNAGFWQYASDTNAMNSTVYMTDRFELKPNGIFWQVTEYTLGLPSKNATRHMHIVNGYLNPFAKAGHGLDSIICDVHIIRQAFIMASDTCYGQSNTDTTWMAVANGKRFELGNRVYAPYDTSGPALYAFFPKGALDIIDKITLYQCLKASDFMSFAKRAVTADMSGVQVETLTKDAVQKIIDAYYRVFLENTLKNVISDKTRQGRGKLKAAFDVTWEGKVVAVTIITISAQYKKYKQSILTDIGSWTFPQLKKNAPPIHIEREFWF